MTNLTKRKVVLAGILIMGSYGLLGMLFWNLEDGFLLYAILLAIIIGVGT